MLPSSPTLLPRVVADSPDGPVHEAIKFLRDMGVDVYSRVAAGAEGTPASVLALRSVTRVEIATPGGGDAPSVSPLLDVCHYGWGAPFIDVQSDNVGVMKAL